MSAVWLSRNVRFLGLFIPFARSTPPCGLTPRRGRQKLRMHWVEGLLQILGPQFALLLAAGDPASRDRGPVGSVGDGGLACAAMIALRLHLLRHPQHLTQALVLHNRSLVDRAQFLVGGVGQ